MGEISRRDFVRAAVLTLAAATVSKIASAVSTAVPELEDCIGRDLLCRIYDGQWDTTGHPDWILGWRFRQVRIECDGQLVVSDSFRANMAACLTDRQPRFFLMRRFYDLNVFQAFAWNGHFAFRGLVGVAGDRVEWPTEEWMVQFLVAPVEQVEREQATHPEVRRWSAYFCDDESRGRFCGGCARNPDDDEALPPELRQRFGLDA